MKRYAVFVGINSYTNDITPLSCASKDATDLSMEFASAGFSRPALLLDANAGSVEILRELSGICRNLQPDDLLVFYFAGHGRELNNEHFLVCQEGYADAGLYNVGSLSMSNLISVTNKPGVRRLFILDCCRDNLLAGRSTAYACENARAIALDMAVKEQPGFIPPLILNSCATGEKAFEDRASGHGYFTKALLETIGDKAVKNFGNFSKVLHERMLARGNQHLDWRGNLAAWENVKLFDTWSGISESVVPAVPVTPAAPVIPENFDSLLWDAEAWTKKFAAGSLVMSDELQKLQWIYSRAEQRGDYAAAVKNLQAFIDLAEKEYQRLKTPAKSGYEFVGTAASTVTVAPAVKKTVPAAGSNLSLAAKAENGDPGAQNDLGYAYEVGQGVAKDLKLAVYWYQKSAEQGFGIAQRNLGLCYEHGKGVAKDLRQAYYWYEKSAENGNSSAMNNLGVCYDKGKGVAPDPQQAYYWYKKSAENGYAYGMNNLGVCYELGQGVAKDLRQAISWYKKSAENGNALAMNNLGLCYDKGKGVAPDPQQAYYWYKKSADKEYKDGLLNLGECFYHGKGVGKNFEQAVYWYKKAAEKGSAYAMFSIGHCCEYGQGVAKNLTQAVSWYKKSAENGSVNAKNALKRLGY